MAQATGENPAQVEQNRPTEIWVVRGEDLERLHRQAQQLTVGESDERDRPWASVEERDLPQEGGCVDFLERLLGPRQNRTDQALDQQVERLILLARGDDRLTRMEETRLSTLGDRFPVGGRPVGEVRELRARLPLYLARVVEEAMLQVPHWPKHRTSTLVGASVHGERYCMPMS